MNAIPPLQIKAGRNGFVLVPDPTAPFPEVLEQLRRKLEESREFFRSARMALDCSRRPFRENEVREVRSLLEQVAGVALAEVRLGGNLQPLLRWASQTLGVGLAVKAEAAVAAPAPARAAGASAGPDASVTVVRTTCRSGTRIEATGDCLVLGDVNPGAEILAVGEIVVFGSLRGIAHAGMLGDRSARIIALAIEPSQIRIADLVALPPQGSKPVGKRYEIAEIRGNRIEVTTI
ncbi:MAG: septum site-determining protein MinC [Syntrophobacteraceae bacterium CG2_30_61_12]|nr:MAG: septum site-determining protein MinC [Syntrophobacteraceae bacterium CG2_30_61_12]